MAGRTSLPVCPPWGRLPTTLPSLLKDLPIVFAGTGVVLRADLACTLLGGPGEHAAGN